MQWCQSQTNIKLHYNIVWKGLARNGYILSGVSITPGCLRSLEPGQTPRESGTVSGADHESEHEVLMIGVVETCVCLITQAISSLFFLFLKNVSAPPYRWVLFIDLLITMWLFDSNRDVKSVIALMAMVNAWNEDIG